MKKIIPGFILLLFCSSQAYCSESSGKVAYYWLHYFNNIFSFSLEGQTGRPACATFGSPSGRYAVDMSTDKGKAVVSAVLAAKASGQLLRATGANTCSLYGDSEDLLYLFTP